MFWPENMVSLSRQRCREPSSGSYWTFSLSTDTLWWDEIWVFCHLHIRTTFFSLLQVLLISCVMFSFLKSYFQRFTKQKLIFLKFANHYSYFCRCLDKHNIIVCRDVCSSLWMYVAHWQHIQLRSQHLGFDSRHPAKYST